MSALQAMMLGAAGELPDPISFTFINHTVSTGSTITPHGDFQAGDVGIYFDCASATTSVTAVTPSGFTSMAAASPAVWFRARASRKIMTGSEGAITGMNGNFDNWKTLLIFRPSRAITTLTNSTWSAQATTGDPSSQSIIAGGQETPVISLAMAWSNEDAAGFSTTSPSFDAIINNYNTGSSGQVAYKIDNPGDTPVNRTVDMGNIEDVNCLMSGWLRAA